MALERRLTEKMLRQGKPVLAVSLPRNEVELARSARAGGADALKVHINLHHHASDTHFGTLREEREALQQIIAVGLPVGIVPGADTAMASLEEMQELDQMGIDFFDAYVHQMPAAMLQMKTRMSRMLALSYHQRNGSFSLGPCAGHCDIIEASIIEPEGYSAPLTVADVCDYGRICRTYPDIPVLVPTQRRIAAEELPLLGEVGVRGIIIGAVVTGQETATIEQVTAEFAKALEELKPRPQEMRG